MGLDLSEHGTYGYPEHMKWRMKTASSSSMREKENDGHEGHDLLVTRSAAAEQTVGGWRAFGASFLFKDRGHFSLHLSLLDSDGARIPLEFQYITCYG